MTHSSLRFGTSGLRGLARDLIGQPSRCYTAAFLDHARRTGQIGAGRVYLARDFRESSLNIVRDCASAIVAAGLEPIDCGTVPTPALALHAMSNGCPAIMVTGSHIPADRNGLKFYVPQGEITKGDEQGILSALGDDRIPDYQDALLNEHVEAEQRFCARYARLLPPQALAGWRVGVFQHSSTARDILVSVLQAAGADVVALGRQDAFVAVDTEAFNDAALAPLTAWIGDCGFDAIVSADGDGDRPLVMDDRGRFVRGDILGFLAARFLGAETVVTPVTSNSAIERVGSSLAVVRTKVGSPYVIAAMRDCGAKTVGFEANGGTLVGAGFQDLPYLPTRDAVLPIIAVLMAARQSGQSVADLTDGLSFQEAVADRLQDISAEKCDLFLEKLGSDATFAERFFEPGGIDRISNVDGVQVHFLDKSVVHFRASGNAPELRCYVEAGSAHRAREMLNWALTKAEAHVR
jgi:phosphomannomutase